MHCVTYCTRTRTFTDVIHPVVSRIALTGIRPLFVGAVRMTPTRVVASTFVDVDGAVSTCPASRTGFASRLRATRRWQGQTLAEATAAVTPVSIRTSCRTVIKVLMLVMMLNPNIWRLKETLLMKTQVDLEGQCQKGHDSVEVQGRRGN